MVDPVSACTTPPNAHLNCCTVASCDDGASAGAALAAGSIDCQQRLSSSGTFAGSGLTLNGAFTYCAGLGAGWRLPTKGEALRIPSTSTNTTACKAPIPGTWTTWTSTCTGSGKANYVTSFGPAGSSNITGSSIGVICIR